MEGFWSGKYYGCFEKNVRPGNLRGEKNRQNLTTKLPFSTTSLRIVGCPSLKRRFSRFFGGLILGRFLTANYSQGRGHGRILEGKILGIFEKNVRPGNLRGEKNRQNLTTKFPFSTTSVRIVGCPSLKGSFTRFFDVDFETGK